MKKIRIFSKKLLLLVVIVIIVDQLFGLIYPPIFCKQQRGKFFTTTYAIKKSSEDIIILGNSHAAEHFDAGLMKQKLGVSVFNLGTHGQSILYYYPLLQSILIHHKPKLVILNLDPNEIEYDPTQYEVLSIFLPYKGINKYVDSAIQLADRMNKYKSLSNLYKNNSTIGYVLLSLFSKSYNKSINSLGFDPQSGNICKKLQAKKAFNSNIIEKEFKTDSLKCKYLLNIITNLKRMNIKLLVTFPPLYEAHYLVSDRKQKRYFDMLREILVSKKVTFLDMTNDPRFSNNCNLFCDQSHLNEQGADDFTNIVINYIKSKPAIYQN